MPLITLTSDIGIQDYLAGAAKGRLLQINPAFNIADITHRLPPYNYPRAAYICRNAIKNFPAFTFHIILVNLFDRQVKRLVLAFHDDQYILCADNGLLTMITQGRPEMLIGLTADPKKMSNTLYCIDIMGTAIQSVTEGKRLLDIGEPDIDITETKHLQPYINAENLEVQIVFIDNFENVILNITREEFESHRRNRPFRIETRKGDDPISSISSSYADVPEGEKLALFNSAGYLEIAMNKGNAASLLFGLMGYNEADDAHLQNHLFYHTVKIFFE